MIYDYETTVTPFEVGSRGFISKDNEKRLKEIHKLVRIIFEIIVNHPCFKGPCLLNPL